MGCRDERKTLARKRKSERPRSTECSRTEIEHHSDESSRTIRSRIDTGTEKAKRRCSSRARKRCRHDELIWTAQLEVLLPPLRLPLKLAERTDAARAQ